MKTSGQSPFVFSNCTDLHTIPERALKFEVNLHGGFAVDKRLGQGQAYYGFPGYGLVKISPDLSRQETIELPADLKALNFHSTKIGCSTESNGSSFLPSKMGWSLS